MNPKFKLRHFLTFAASSLVAISSTSAQTTATYNGPATLGNTNTWMTPANWSSGAVPAGAVNVVIPDNKGVVAWDDATPAYTGNLTLGTAATLQMGYTTTRTASYNALGKPGTTLITMVEGSHIFCRTPGSFIMPEILLTGNGMVSLGTSTTPPAECVFNYPINGAFRFTLGTNASGGGVKLNAPNTFTSMVIQGIGGRGKTMNPFAANVPGALGLGDVTTIGASPSTADYRCPQIQFNATDVMRVTSKLILNGKGPSSNGNDRILMNQSATIGGLVIDGVAMAPGVYTTSQTWLDGPGTLTVLLISPLFPDPAFGKVVPPGNVNLTWTNEAPTTGTDVWSDVWFGTNPASLTQVATKQLNLTSFTVSAPTVSTYYWRVDSYLDGNSSGTPKTGGVYHFVVNDSDGDGMPDEWEQLYTDPSSPTALEPGLDADSDSLTNLREYQLGTIPNDPDTDDDVLLDGHETKTGSWVSATNTGTDPLDDDSDGDSLLDGAETKTGTWVSATDTGTDPNNWDSDRDALSDTVETNTGTLIDKTNTGTNPNLPDTDNDGAGDWYEVTATFTNPNLDSSAPGIPYPLPDPDASAGATNKPVKVYIMSGQSNMVGMGTVFGTDEKTLESMTLRQNKFPNLVDAAGAWTTRQDVHYRGVVTDITNAKLSGGALGTVFGPELGFGQIMGWYHDEPVLLLKSSDGNRALSWDILPPGSPSWVYNGTNYPGYGGFGTWPVGGTPPTSGGWYAGREYDHFFLDENDRAFPPNTTNNTTNINVVDVLDNFATEYPGWAAQGFEIAGFVWWQGEKDTLNTAYATTYEEHLVTLIPKLREYYTNRYPGKVLPNAPFVLGTLGEASLSMTTPESEVAVRDAHLAVDGDFGRYPQFAGNVKTVYTHPLSEGGTGNGHYDGRAGTYMLVGDALGRAMLDLQDDETPPIPNPMTFEIAPQGAGSGSIAMKASAASDGTLPIQYYFENTTNGNFRDWSTSREWTNTGLTDGTPYSYRVKARDGNNLEGQWSAALSATAGADATAPTPNPMTFAVLPNALGETSITMTATTAIDLTAVQYYFTCTAGGGPDSGWQSATVFTPTGLAHSTTYTYTVMARDAVLNQTAPSAAASATTATPDLIPPTPDPMTFASPPTSAGFTSITMTATTASDPSGVEYFFKCTAGGGPDSAWQSSTVFTPTGLAHSTSYTYTVQARDKSPAQNITAASSPASATTDTPDTTAPSPDPMTFVSPPTALGQSSIGMTATTATDPSGVQYFFECTAGGGHSSAWQDSPTYTDTGLTSETQYTYRVRARDKSAAQTATAWSATASATTAVPGVVATFTGANKTNGDNWNVSTNWDTSAVPTGAVNVSIPASKQVTAYSATTPTYYGNLSIGSNALLQIGYGTGNAQSYNALGTLGTTTIFMAGGSQLAVSRISGTYIIPAIQLDGNAIIRTGESTNTAPTLNFNHPITGAYTVTFQGKSDSKVNLNAANSFSALVADWKGYTAAEMTITAAAAGSLGNGDVTIKPFTDGKSCALLVISAANAMADTATLTLNGSSANKLTMNANDTIGKLVVNGAVQPAGTYGKVGQSGVDYQVGWIKSTSTGILTVSGPSSNYWDKNGTTAGAGGATPTGTWGVNTYWSPSAAGDAATGTWNAGYLGVFAAGTDATGGYQVTVSGTQQIGGLTVGEGNVTLSGDELQMTSDALASVATSSTLTVGNIISNDATPRQLAKGGSGTLTLSGANTYTGSTNVGGGTLSIPTTADAGSDSPLGNFASLGADGMTLAGGTLQYTGSTATTNRGFTLLADSTVDVSAAGTVLTLGASSGGGTLTVTGGSGSRLSLGPVTLGATNLTLNPTTGILTVASVTGWSAIINGATAPTLVLGGSASGNSLTGIYSGVGLLTKTGTGDWKLNGASTYTGNTTVQTGNLIAGTNALNNAAGAFGQQNGGEIVLGVANGNTAAGILTGGAFTVGRPIRLATNNATDAGTRVLTLGGNTAHNSTFSAAIHLGTASQTSKGISLTAAAGGQVTFSGVIQNPTGQDAAETAAAAALTAVTKVGPGTVVLTNTHTYTGATRVSDGTLSVTGSLGATAVSVNAGTLSGNGNFGGNVTIASGATHALAVAATTAGQDTSAITGTLAMAGSILNLTAAATPAPGVYVLATATVDITGTPATINTNGISGTVSVDTASSPKRLLLTVTVGSPFETWAGSGVTFDADANNDGVDNGMAWLLGAANPSENSLGKLPVASRNGASLRLTFRCLKSTKRGGAVLKVQSSSDMGLADPWTNHEAAVPDGDATVNGVVFDTTDDGDYINVIADIPATGGKLFARLNAVNTP